MQSFLCMHARIFCVSWSCISHSHIVCVGCVTVWCFAGGLFQTLLHISSYTSSRCAVGTHVSRVGCTACAVPGSFVVILFPIPRLGDPDTPFCQPSHPGLAKIRGWDSLSLPSLPTLGEDTGFLDITHKMDEYFIFGGTGVALGHTL